MCTAGTLKTLIRGPSQNKCTERNTYRIEHQMCGKVLWSFSVVPLLPNDCIPTFWKVHDIRQVSRTVELSDASGYTYIAYIADTVALQEICWTGSGILEKRDCTLFYSCDNKDHLLGTGFLVSKSIKHLIIDFKPITPKICTLRMKGNFFKITV